MGRSDVNHANLRTTRVEQLWDLTPVGEKLRRFGPIDLLHHWFGSFLGVVNPQPKSQFRRWWLVGF